MLDRFRQSKFWRFLVMLWDDAFRIDIFKDAYAMTFVTLLSLIPSLAASFSLISLFTPIFGENSTWIADARLFILRNLATGSGEQAIAYLENFLANTDFTKIGATGFVGLIVTLTLLLKQIEEALNRIFDVRLPRTMLERFLYFWVALTLGTLIIGLAIGTLSSFAWDARFVEVSALQTFFRTVGYLGGVVLAFFLLFKFGPNRYVPWRPAALGALIAATLLIQAIRFFGLYVTGFTRYEAVYGALAALPIFMVWLQFVWIITLLGALITKRLMDGLPKANFRSEKVQGSIRNEYFEIVLPLLVLLKTYEFFEMNQGKGASPEKIAHELFVSTTIVNAAFDRLTKAELVLPHHLNGGRGHNDVFFPRMPANDLTAMDVKKRLLGTTSAWVNCITPADTAAIHTDYPAAIQAYLRGENKGLATFIVRERLS